MDMELIKLFFMWMTILNLAVMMLQTVMCILLKNWITRMHGKMFGLSAEVIKATIYGYLGAYKVVFIVFVLTPWIALMIIT